MSYWQDRFLQLEAAQHNKSAEKARYIEKQYEKAIANIEKDITAWYTRYATENGVSMAEAKRVLNTRELAEFRWTVEEYIEKGRQNAISGEWAAQLERASVKVHVTRLEAIKMQMQQQCELALGNTVDTLDKHLKNIYLDGYCKTAFEIQKGLGVGYEFATLDDNLIDKVLSKPWAVDNKTFSDRVWGDYKPKMVNILENDLTQAIMRGDDLQGVINKIANDCNVTKGAASRLVMTESAYFSSLSTLDGYKATGVEQYEILATLDGVTCSRCGKLDGEHHPISKYIIGTEYAPPFHANCRCTTVPYYDDMDDLVTRVARDNEGKTYEIDENIKYSDWKAAFVDGGSKDNFKPKDFINRTFEERIADLAKTYTALQGSLTNIAEKIKTTKTDITNLEATEIDLSNQRYKAANEYAKYAQYEDIDIDTSITEKQAKIKELQDRVDELEKSQTKYYDRPERGTPEREEWREWRKNFDFESNFNELVDKKVELQKLTDELDTLKDIKSGKINIKGLKKEIDRLDKEISNNRKLRNDLKDRIKSLEDNAATTHADVEKLLQKAGGEFSDEVSKKVTTLSNKMSEAEKRVDKAYHDYIDKKITWDDYLKTATERNKIRNTFYYDNAADVKATLQRVRKCGGVDVKAHLNKSRSPMAKVIQQAYDHYPTEWIEKSIKFGNLTPRKVQRGYYSGFNKIIAISGNGGASSFKTAIHELGHRFEHIFPEMLQAEKTFYDRRTVGEALQWLGGSYRKDEKSRFDKFIDKYMGKDYKGSAYELVSMGFELAFTDPVKLMQDEDMAKLIFGLLCLG